VHANRWLRYRVPLGFLFAAWYLWLTRYVRPEMLGICVVLVAAGCALRAWAAGYLLKGKRVAVGGPYAYVRNPLYCGSFVIGLGFCLALYRAPLPPWVFLFWVFYLVGFIVIYMGKSRAEEEELARNLGATYVDYRRQVPALFPVFGRVRGLGGQRFSADLYRRNREYQCLWGSLAVLAFLFWRVWNGY
jgi:protein-S-isoprenylcysteine O-methyltransferase Ste14